jgi:hypothetical protein
MAKRLDRATLDAVHDLEAEIDELKTRAISLQASLDATTDELAREREGCVQLVTERDYFCTFATEIATRLFVLREGIDAILKAAELAGYRPVPVPSFKRAAAEEVDAVLAELGRKFGANAAEPVNDAASPVEGCGAAPGNPLDKRS